RDVLAEVGWAGALLFNERTGRLIDGHARKKVAAGPVPVLIGSWTEEQERKILATLDPLAARAEADKQALDVLLGEVQPGSEAVAGLLAELAARHGVARPGTDALCDPDAVPAPPDAAGTKPGDLWLLGDHRLLCGDSSKPQDVDRLLGGAAVHLVN